MPASPPAVATSSAKLSGRGVPCSLKNRERRPSSECSPDEPEAEADEEEEEAAAVAPRQLRWVAQKCISRSRRGRAAAAKEALAVARATSATMSARRGGCVRFV